MDSVNLEPRPSLDEAIATLVAIDLVAMRAGTDEMVPAAVLTSCR